MYVSQLLNPSEIHPGSETSDVSLFSWDEIPWNNLAFPTVTAALKYAQLNLDSGDKIIPQNLTKNREGILE